MKNYSGVNHSTPASPYLDVEWVTDSVLVTLENNFCIDENEPLSPARFVPLGTHTITLYPDLETTGAKFALKSFTERYYLHHNKDILRGFSLFEVTPVQGYDPFDFQATRYGADFLGEIKIRQDRNFNFSEGALLEVQKYESLMKLYRETGREPLYVCFWKCGTLSIQNLLSYTSPQVQEIKCPTTTVGNGKYVPKPCYLLPFANGTELFQYQIPDKDVILVKFGSKYIQQHQYQ